MLCVVPVPTFVLTEIKPIATIKVACMNQVRLKTRQGDLRKIFRYAFQHLLHALCSTRLRRCCGYNNPARLSAVFLPWIWEC